MFELILKASDTTQDGSSITITDESDWSLADALRDKFGVFIKGTFQVDETPSDVTITTYDPLVDDSWDASSPSNGRYIFTAYAFIEQNEVVPSEGDVQINATTGELFQWVSAAWVAITLDDAIAADKAYYTSTPLDVPLLSYAYALRNDLNLEYIKQVKGDIEGGAEQNKLYYKRTDLDYVKALILGAEYNWALGLYSNFYQTVNNLNDIIESKQIS